MNKIEYAIQLRKNGEIKEAKEYLLNLHKNYQDDPDINYQIAWCCDLLEEETEAIHYYKSAINLNLNTDDLVGAYLGLGSSYRATGNYLEAKNVFTHAIFKYPNRNEFKVFLSIVYYNTGEFELGYKLLLDVILNTTKDENILEYKSAINLYKENLNKKWD